jgi:hypothetical protein
MNCQYDGCKASHTHSVDVLSVNIRVLCFIFL